MSISLIQSNTAENVETEREKLDSVTGELGRSRYSDDLEDSESEFVKAFVEYEDTDHQMEDPKDINFSIGGIHCHPM